MPLLRVEAEGLWCEAGGFYIDPWQPVSKALITHAHSDHARPGSVVYLCAEPSKPILTARLGPEVAEAQIQTLPYGQSLGIGSVTVSFHPAGHILGSAQIRVECRGEVWVVSGDYKLLAPDSTCAPFEPIRCHTFVTESTFGLPIYRWAPQNQITEQIDAWWRSNQNRGQCSVIFGYPIGKAQRILAALKPETGPVFCHGAVEKMNAVYRSSGVPLPATRWTNDAAKGFDWSRALVIAPPSAQGSLWMRRFGPLSTAMASGWMRIRGTRRRKSLDRGFVLSDHADWPGVLDAIAATEASCVLVTHGYRGPLVRWLMERGIEARSLDTQFENEGDEIGVESDSGAEPDQTAEPGEKATAR
jgi:putative mRNA 3-end processing factor